jgi:hypothetical protein
MLSLLCRLLGHIWDERPGPAWLSCKRCCQKIGH